MTGPDTQVRNAHKDDPEAGRTVGVAHWSVRDLDGLSSLKGKARKEINPCVPMCFTSTQFFLTKETD